MPKTKLLEEALSLIVHDGTAPLRSADFFIERAEENLESGNFASVGDDLQKLKESIDQSRAVINAVRKTREIMQRAGSQSSFSASDLQVELAFTFRNDNVTFDMKDVMIEGCYPLLIMALSELVGNALQHSTAGAAEVRIEQTSESVIYTVGDSGPGIPEEFQKNATKPFQVGTIEKKRAGFRGLGLFYARLAAVTIEADLEFRRRDGAFEVAIVQQVNSPM
ncbi:ATP-binding protein [Donghicola eburneus]|uniref:ATP-binding protein n=1 Tax=Donghicola eburneus TaxID=393278 RepID=UPI0008E9F086|nr:HAMP domain-containing sensor histidine kinase [Donghicola eburneus]SFQ78299.1 Histidine kinase-, DNA gyrase B-, and HSP90-like ATPase [Donghicola eburneus]